jgi:hypothetical protein
MNVFDPAIASRRSAMSPLLGHNFYPTLLSPMRVGPHLAQPRDHGFDAYPPRA